MNPYVAIRQDEIYPEIPERAYEYAFKARWNAKRDEIAHRKRCAEREISENLFGMFDPHRQYVVTNRGWASEADCDGSIRYSCVAYISSPRHISSEVEVPNYEAMNAVDLYRTAVDEVLYRWRETWRIKKNALEWVLDRIDQFFEWNNKKLTQKY